jgi:hypothetical protein
MMLICGVLASCSSEDESTAPLPDGKYPLQLTADMKANDYVLTPGRYVGAADIEDDGVLFEEKMRELSQTLFQQMKQAETLDQAIRQNLEALGYGE